MRIIITWHIVSFQKVSQKVSLPTAREGNVFTRVCHSLDNWPHGYSALLILVTVLLVRILLEYFLVESNFKLHNVYKDRIAKPKFQLIFMHIVMR